ncbi:MAG: DNA-3-methyladenine glycosylase [Anaerolineae bacterium]
MFHQLPTEFYARPTLTVARELLNKRLVRRLGDQRLSGRIVEVEAYLGTDDAASHARFGKTKRNAAMFGPPGHAYVYLIYGLHHCLNVVTETVGRAAAILVRALEPEEGTEVQQQHRGGRPLKELTNGPGKLCQALSIDLSFDGADLCAPDAALWIEDAPTLPDEALVATPRVNVTGDERARSVPWRWYIRGTPWVSRQADHQKS